MTTVPTATTNGRPALIYSDQTAFDGPREVVGYGTDTFYVKMMDRRLANDIIKQNHYSGKIYAGTKLHLGVYAPTLLGVLQYGVAMNPASQASVVEGTKGDEYLELNRMWLDESLPRNSESMAVSYSIHFIKHSKHFHQVAWIQSFADEKCGKFGVVYQACNFLYCGCHWATWWEIEGEMVHNSILTRSPDLCPKAKAAQAKADLAKPSKRRQFRYIFFIKHKFRKRLLKKVEPYPKYASEVSMVTRATPSGEGGVQFSDDAPIKPKLPKPKLHVVNQPVLW